MYCFVVVFVVVVVVVAITPLSYAFIGCFLCTPYPEIEPAILAVWTML